MSTASPLTEATLDGSEVTVTLAGVRSSVYLLHQTCCDGIGNRGRERGYVRDNARERHEVNN